MANPVKKAQARSNADAILQVWQQGKESQCRLDKLNESNPSALKFGNRGAVHRLEAEKLGTSLEAAEKMRRVAADYSREQIKELARHVRESHARFSKTHLLTLCRVKSRRQRKSLTRRAIEENWSVTKLDRAIQADKGRRRAAVGRKPWVPSDAVERLLALDAIGEKWCRWCDAARGGLPAGLLDLIDKSTATIRELQQAAAKQIQQLRAASKSQRQR